MNILCTICARSGSKGVKNKNLFKVNGKPLIFYSIKQALKSKMFNEIVVSTDSAKIQKYSKLQGAYSWFLRSKELSNDYAPKTLVVRDALKRSETFFNKKYDVIIDLDVSSPLRYIKDVTNAYKFFLKKKANFLISASRSRKNPYFNILENKKNKVNFVKIKKKYTRRQDAPKTYDANSSIYIWKRKELLNFKSLFPKKTVIYEMPAERSWDIDNKFDLYIVKNIMKDKFKKYNL